MRSLRMSLRFFRRWIWSWSPATMLSSARSRDRGRGAPSLGGRAPPRTRRPPRRSAPTPSRLRLPSRRGGLKAGDYASRDRARQGEGGGYFGGAASIAVDFGAFLWHTRPRRKQP